MPEVNELFAGWGEYTPTNLLVKAIVEGLGGGVKEKPMAEQDIPPEAMEAMRNSALTAIAAKAGSRVPILQGRDPGLPKAEPAFDLEEMRRRNADVLRRRAMMKVADRVG